MRKTNEYTLPASVQAHVDELVSKAPPIGKARARRIARMLYPESGVSNK